MDSDCLTVCEQEGGANSEGVAECSRQVGRVRETGGMGGFRQRGAAQGRLNGQPQPVVQAQSELPRMVAMGLGVDRKSSRWGQRNR